MKHDTVVMLAVVLPPLLVCIGALLYNGWKLERDWKAYKQRMRELGYPVDEEP